MNYYEILQVPYSATKEIIKKAYKQLAMDHHPDHGGDSNTFIKVNEAYNTLKNDDTRQEYNRLLVRQLTNPSIRQILSVTLEQVATGDEIFIEYPLHNKQTATATIRIPAGVENGTVIRYAGLGDNMIMESPRGDLLIRIVVQQHKKFNRNGSTLYANCTLPVFYLILGGEIQIPSLTNKAMHVIVPRGTQHGTEIVIKHCGLVDCTTGIIGDLYLKINGIIPENLDSDKIKRIQALHDEINKST
jgi:DnaJ-class molecular chaperone